MAETEKKVPWYNQKKFKDEKLAALQGLMPERRATRIVNRYLRSDAGQQEEAAFVKAEIEKQNASRDAYLAKARQQIWDKYPAQTLTPTAEIPAQQVTPELPKLQPKTQPVAAPRAGGNTPPATPTVPSGQRAVPTPSAGGGETPATPSEYYTDNKGNRYSYIDNKLTQLTEDQTSNWTHKGAIKDMEAFKQAAAANSKHIDFGGIKWINPYFTGFDLDTFAKQAGLSEKKVFDGNTYYRYDPDGLGDYWVSDNGSIYNSSVGGGLGRLRSGVIDGNSMAGYKQLVTALNAAKAGQSVGRLGRMANGGTMNRINYFQRGGAAPQQDVKAQVVALVQAAIQGDEKANQQVNQIMEAAKAGNQQAVQLAQMITEVAKQLQGQATSAKWGAKLDYIHALKCGGKTRKKKQHGGKFCPSCK